MNEHPDAKSPAPDSDYQLVPSHSDLVVLVPSRDEPPQLLIEQAPPWVAKWVGKTPREIEGEAVGEAFAGVVDDLAATAEDVFRQDVPVEGYCMEFRDAAGRERAARIRAERVANYRLAPASRSRPKAEEVGPAVLVHIDDVTEQMQERRRWLGIGAFHGIIGRSQPMLAVFYKIEVYGPTDAAVVISGETGTGKELVARALHERSRRSRNPFVAVNCTALSEELFESELFGHERGAFTGAVRSHKGRFERADKGTLFLDEIGDMPPRTQAKLLRALERGMIERVGGERELAVDARILAATNVSLEQAVALRHFRADLYHRLSVLRIHVPPLRERLEDMPLLVENYLQVLSRRYGRQGVRLTPDAMRLLGEYHWPGNVRELHNVLERVFVETPGAVIGRQVFAEWVRERDYLTAGGWNLEQLESRRSSAPVLITPPGQVEPGTQREADGRGDEYWPAGGRGPAGEPPRLAGPSFPLALAAGARYGGAGGGVIDAVYSIKRPGSRKPKPLTEEMIRQAFEQAKGNATEAARRLGVHKATLYRHMKKCGLTREQLAAPSERRHEPNAATNPPGSPRQESDQ